MIDGWLAFFVLAATLSFSNFCRSMNGVRILIPKMSTSAAPIQNWLNVGLGFFYPEICQLCETNARRPRTVLSARNAGRKCVSSARRFANAAACRLKATSRRLLNARIAGKWICISVPRVPPSSRNPSCWKQSTVSNIRTRFGLSHFLAGLFLREAMPALREQIWDFIAPVPLHSVKATRTRIQPG